MALITDPALRRTSLHSSESPPCVVRMKPGQLWRQCLRSAFPPPLPLRLSLGPPARYYFPLPTSLWENTGAGLA
jgi:hypothetical protein